MLRGNALFRLHFLYRHALFLLVFHIYCVLCRDARIICVFVNYRVEWGISLSGRFFRFVAFLWIIQKFHESNVFFFLWTGNGTVNIIHLDRKNSKRLFVWSLRWQIFKTWKINSSSNLDQKTFLLFYNFKLHCRSNNWFIFGWRFYPTVLLMVSVATFAALRRKYFFETIKV